MNTKQGTHCSGFSVCSLGMKHVKAMGNQRTVGLSRDLKGAELKTKKVIQEFIPMVPLVMKGAGFRS